MKCGVGDFEALWVVVGVEENIFTTDRSRCEGPLCECSKIGRSYIFCFKLNFKMSEGCVSEIFEVFAL